MRNSPAIFCVNNNRAWKVMTSLFSACQHVQYGIITSRQSQECLLMAVFPCYVPPAIALSLSTHILVGGPVCCAYLHQPSTPDGKSEMLHGTESIRY